jgi:coproporphyrinogen III oxidase-like Fe-S oxidoreductase
MLKTGLRLPSVSIYQLWDVDSIPATRSRTHADLYSGGAVFSALYDLQTSLYNLGYHMGAGASFVRTDPDRHEWTIHRCTAFRHLGFGSGSYSFAPSAFIQRARRIEEYVSSASSATDYDALDSDLNRYYPLTPAELEIRRAIVGLRSACTVEGLRIEVSPASDEELATLAQLDRKIQSLTELGILGRDEHGSLALSESHFLLTNAISSYLHPADVPRRRER